MEKIIKNRRGEKFVFLFDDQDLYLVEKYKWFVCKNKSNRYIKSTQNISGKQVTLIFHRVVMNVMDPKVIIDHRNHNGLDNRRLNLRLCDNKSNTRNTSSTSGSTSKYLGVSFYTSRKKWVAVITVDGKVKFLGYHLNEDDAAKSYDMAAKKFFGEFANVNFK